MHVSRQALDGPFVVSELVTHQTEVVACRYLETDITERRADGERALARLDGAVVPRREQRHGQKRAHPSEPRLISKGLGVGLGLTKDVVDPREVPERVQRMAEVDPHVDGMLEGFPMLREVPEDFQCLLEVVDRAL